MANVKKYIAGLSPMARAVVFKHVYRVQYARSWEDLTERIEEAQAAWRARPDCVLFEQKFTKQWLAGRFIAWHCLATPPGYAKANNPVEQFNKQVKRDYTLRSLVTVNTLAQDLISLSHHQSARVKTFEFMPRASDDEIRRYKSLVREGRLVVTNAYRSSVSFMLDGIERRQYRVLQSGQDPVKPKKKIADIIREEEIASDRAIETFGQPSTGWMVDIDQETCQCRKSFKFGVCIHIMAAQVHAGLYVEGVTKKRKFVTKRVNTRGRRAEVGHALAME